MQSWFAPSRCALAAKQESGYEPQSIGSMCFRTLGAPDIEMLTVAHTRRLRLTPFWTWMLRLAARGARLRTPGAWRGALTTPAAPSSGGSTIKTPAVLTTWVSHAVQSWSALKLWVSREFPGTQAAQRGAPTRHCGVRWEFPIARGPNIDPK